MSWSLNTVGNVDQLAAEIQKKGATLDGQEKADFDTITAPLMEILKQPCDATKRKGKSMIKLSINCAVDTKVQDDGSVVVAKRSLNLTVSTH